MQAKGKYSLTLDNLSFSSQQLVLSYILYPCKLRDLQSETFVYLALRRIGLIDLSDEYIFGYVQKVLTSAEVLFFPRKLNHCFWRVKHDFIYHRKGIPVNTIFISVSAFHG